MEGTAETFLTQVMALHGRMAVLEARVDQQEKALKEFGDKVTALQASIDKIGEKMVFVERLETMDNSVAMLVKMAKGVIYVIGTGAALLVAFSAKDAGMMKDLLGALL